MRETHKTRGLLILVVIWSTILLGCTPDQHNHANNDPEQIDLIEYWEHLDIIEINESRITRDYVGQGNWTITDHEIHSFSVSYATFGFSWNPVSVTSKKGVVWIQLKPHNPFGSLDEETAFLKREIEHLCTGEVVNIGVSGYSIQCEGYPTWNRSLVNSKTGIILCIAFAKMNRIEGNVIHVKGVGSMYPYNLSE